MKLAFCVLAAALLAGCGSGATSSGPAELVTGAYCELDGMMLADYPGPKGQIRYAGGKVEYFCDTVELLSMYLQPEQVRKIDGAYTQDMGKTDWEHPQGHWISIESAFFVADSRRIGSMGPTIGAFSSRAEAEAFVGQQGGRVLTLAEITPELVQLNGGMNHDSGM